MSGATSCGYCGGMPAKVRHAGEPATCSAHSDLPALELGERRQLELERQELDKLARAAEWRLRLHSRR